MTISNESGAPTLAFENPEPPKKAPRPTINTQTCARCHCWHTTREEMMACLANREQP